MGAIKGKQKVAVEDFGKKIGLVEVEVLIVNPTEEQYKDILGMELKEDSKAAIYKGESKDGNNYVRVDFWLRPTVKEGEPLARPYKVSFFLEDKDRLNKNETKTQFINNIGICSWGEDDSNLPEWFSKRDFRIAKGGEEDFYGFLRNWLGGLDYRDGDTVLELNWKDLMKGNISMLTEQVGGEFATSFIGLATVAVKGEGENIKEYQGIYNKGFLPSYTLRHFALVDYSDPAVLAKLAAKTTGLKIHERFVKNVVGEYGCKDVYSLKLLSDYIAEDHIVSSDDPMNGSDSEDAEY